MEIILMRHGKLAFAGSSRITSSEMAEWISEYELSDTGRNTAPQPSKSLASSALHIMSSFLPRALSSLRVLERQPDLTDDIFSEADLPVFRMPPFKLYSVFRPSLFRVMWLCNVSGNVEALRMAKQSAVRATVILIKSAKVSNGPVLLMGHGVMNQLIAKKLISSGWKECHRQRGYWNAGIYSLL